MDTTHQDPTAVEEAINNFIANSDECAKLILQAYKRTVRRETNVNNLSKFQFDALEKCATALGIPLYSKECITEKIYTTSAKLSERIILMMEAHLPSYCDECKQVYTSTRKTDVCWLQCFLCSQEAHHCDKVQQKVDAFKLLQGKLEGSVWLCHDCRTQNDYFGSQILNFKSLQIESSNQEANDANIATDNQGQASMANNVSQSQVNEQSVTHSPEQTICKDYRHGKCYRNDCKYQHPDKCLDYCRYGREGCSKGYDGCKLLHPVLCRSSLRYGECYNKSCTYAHLKGTIRARQRHNFSHTYSKHSDQPQNRRQYSERSYERNDNWGQRYDVLPPAENPQSQAPANESQYANHHNTIRANQTPYEHQNQQPPSCNPNPGLDFLALFQNLQAQIAEIHQRLPPLNIINQQMQPIHTQQHP